MSEVFSDDFKTRVRIPAAPLVKGPLEGTLRGQLETYRGRPVGKVAQQAGETSQSSLQLRGEMVVQVHPLPLRESGKGARCIGTMGKKSQRAQVLGLSLVVSVPCASVAAASTEVEQCQLPTYCEEPRHTDSPSPRGPTSPAPDPPLTVGPTGDPPVGDGPTGSPPPPLTVREAVEIMRPRNVLREMHEMIEAMRPRNVLREATEAMQLPPCTLKRAIEATRQPLHPMREMDRLRMALRMGY